VNAGGPSAQEEVVVHLSVSFRHCEASPALTDAIDRRARRLAGRYDGDARFDAVCDMDGPRARVELRARVLGALLRTHANDSDACRAAELAFERLERRARRHHDRLVRRRRRGHALLEVAA
jgi:ribosome-associated translation inhibitor RaiA